ncbi:copia protein [Nephila pilipes]|uniref:Copia protein n=1 Tax=Nephila pilipes TaxID=299642 RepID=A0A8X6JR41_NEPPI|nr:copia protein [Nephila pilipes]
MVGNLNLSNIRTFGSKAFAYVHKSKRRKLDAKSIEVIRIGYDQRSKGYRIYISDHHIIISRTARFTEDNQKENVTITPLPSTEMININEESDDEQGNTSETESIVLPR